MRVEKFLSALSSAWEELIVFPLPEFFRRNSGSGKRNVLTAAAFPLLGFIIGIIIALIVLLLDMTAGRMVAALVFALAGWGMLRFRDSARGDNRLGKYLSGRMKNYDGGEGGVNLLMLLPGMIKFVILLLLGLSGSFFYIAVLLTAAFAFQAALVVDEECPLEFLDRSDTAVKIFRGTLIVLGILCFACCRLGTVVALVVVLAGFNITMKRLKNDGFSAENISFSGTLVEMFMLLAGLLAI